MIRRLSRKLGDPLLRGIEIDLERLFDELLESLRLPEALLDLLRRVFFFFFFFRSLLLLQDLDRDRLEFDETYELECRDFRASGDPERERCRRLRSLRGVDWSLLLLLLLLVLDDELLRDFTEL